MGNDENMDLETRSRKVSVAPARVSAGSVIATDSCRYLVFDSDPKSCHGWSVSRASTTGIDRVVGVEQAVREGTTE